MYKVIIAVYLQLKKPNPHMVMHIYHYMKNRHRENQSVGIKNFVKGTIIDNNIIVGNSWLGLLCKYWCSY